MINQTRTVSTPAEMKALGREFAQRAKAGEVFALIGTLGTGKTHWSKGFVEVFDPQAEVTSPTFGIVNEYAGGDLPIFHFDFYRLKSEAELIALGWDEYLDQPGIMICEWADRFPQLLPPHTTWLMIQHQGEGSRTCARLTNAPKALDESF